METLVITITHKQAYELLERTIIRGPAADVNAVKALIRGELEAFMGHKVVVRG